MKDEEEISRLLASLKGVDAPENFEGAVRSRIAKRRDVPSMSRPGRILIAKFAFPLLLLLVVGGFLIVSNERELIGDVVPPVDDGTHGVAVVDDDSRSEPSGISNTRSVNSGIAQVPVNRGGPNSRRASQGGSEDIALSPDDSTVFPDGVDPRKSAVTTGQLVSEGNVSAISVLSMLGISAKCSGTGCAAGSVRKGSLAAKAGIQSGDIVSAIDGRPINASTAIVDKSTVSELTIIRADKRMNVSIARR